MHAFAPYIPPARPAAAPGMRCFFPVGKPPAPGDKPGQLRTQTPQRQSCPLLSRLVPALRTRLSTGIAHPQAAGPTAFSGLIPNFAAALL